MWSKNLRVILFCDIETDERKNFQDSVNSYLKGGEIKVVGRKPTFAKIEISDEVIKGKNPKEIALIVIDKVFKLYKSVFKCLELEPNK